MEEIQIVCQNHDCRVEVCGSNLGDKKKGSVVDEIEKFEKHHPT